jgi:hypothetical protein
VTAKAETRRVPGQTGQAGQAMVEFSVVAFLTIMMLLFVVETARMALVYTVVAESAREGVRYAIVHGSTRPAGTADYDSSGPGNNPAQVVTVVDNFAGTAPLSLSLLLVNVTYPGNSNAPGQSVNVSVVYPYNPLTTFFPATVQLGSVSQGIILF